jgi:hypothetical protein
LKKPLFFWLNALFGRRGRQPSRCVIILSCKNGRKHPFVLVPRTPPPACGTSSASRGGANTSSASAVHHFQLFILTLFELVGGPATNRSEKQSYIKFQCKVNSWATLPRCILTFVCKSGGMPSSASAKLIFIPPCGNTQRVIKV